MSESSAVGGRSRRNAEFLIRFVRLDELRRLHLDDGTGHCATCSEGGQAGRSVSPCRIARYVERAPARGN